MSPKSCLGCTKWFLFLLNLLFFFLGIFLLAFSFWLLFDRQSFATVLGSPLVSLRVWSYAFSGVGIATMLLGFLGCLGALKEVKVMLGLYFGLLLLLFTAQITVAIIVYTQRTTLATKVAVYTEELIRGYPAQGPPGDTHESWDAVQQQVRFPKRTPKPPHGHHTGPLPPQLGCCGWKGPQDWDHHDDATRDRDGAIACSCLRAHNSTHKTPSMFPHGRCPMAALQDIFPRGCKERVQTWLAGNLVTIVGVCIGIGLGELFLLMLSMFLVRNLDSHYEKLLRGL
ncbi:leukocyte antigen CD37 isoform X2 [Poecile atricapillus]|uniref:leukocyte antigen CD37 isoform X2 n=1 Tax=Poecile atricapillus TaxID=48891 RepID=UPI00273921A8|nr:leukocyte antigen CD37 isoform X2 [Poecile atricapillus]